MRDKETDGFAFSLLTDSAINLLDPELKFKTLKKWVENYREKYGLEATLTIERLWEMIEMVEGVEKQVDDTLIESLG